MPEPEQPKRHVWELEAIPALIGTAGGGAILGLGAHTLKTWSVPEKLDKIDEKLEKLGTSVTRQQIGMGIVTTAGVVYLKMRG